MLYLDYIQVQRAAFPQLLHLLLAVDSIIYTVRLICAREGTRRLSSSCLQKKKNDDYDEVSRPIRATSHFLACARCSCNAGMSFVHSVQALSSDISLEPAASFFRPRFWRASQESLTFITPRAAEEPFDDDIEQN